jgi:hypothetical protein
MDHDPGGRRALPGVARGSVEAPGEARPVVQDRVPVDPSRALRSVEDPETRERGLGVRTRTFRRDDDEAGSSGCGGATASSAASDSDIDSPATPTA